MYRTATIIVQWERVVKTLIHMTMRLGLLWFTFCLVLLIVGCKDSKREAIIEGGSMVPALYGKHYRVQCEDCEFRFKVNTKLPRQKTFVCPNCGFDQNQVPNVLTESDRVRIVSNGELQRWDLVALRRLSDKYHVVKRLVGLPGEEVSIESGDVFVDGARATRKLEEQIQTRVLVHDSGYMPNSGLESRWKPQRSTSGWSVSEAGYRFSSLNKENDDWLVYHNRRGFRHFAKRCDEFPVEDSYPFNQTNSRKLVSCPDLMVEIEFADQLNSDLTLRLVRGEKHFDVVLDKLGDRQVSMQNAKDGFVRLDCADFVVRRVILSSFDRILTVSLRSAHEHSFALVEHGTPAMSATPFQIRCKGSEESITRLRVYRDIYYRNLVDAPNKYKLGTNEYFFLGDNVPMSVDSRNWFGEEDSIEILGRVRAN